jgi:hypothetical protein
VDLFAIPADTWDDLNEEVAETVYSKKRTAASSSSHTSSQPQKKTKKKRSKQNEEESIDKSPLEDCALLCAECSGFIEGSDVKKGYLDEPFCEHCVDRPLLCNFWIPLHDVEVNQSVLAVLLDSHTLDNYYFIDPVDSDMPKSYRTHSDCLSWATANFQAGDIVFFDSSLVG